MTRPILPVSVALSVAGAVVIADRLEPAAFGRFLGGVPPLLAAGGSVVVGLLALGVLRRWGWHPLWPAGEARRAIVTAWLAGTVLAIPAILMDWMAPLSEAINVAPPAALAFYPAIGWIAEVAFHLVPLAGLLWILGSRRRIDPRHPGFWLALLTVALVEPVFQMLPGGVGEGGTRPWVGFQVLLFGLVSLWCFRRYGFASAYLLRLVYYLHWHVLWGQARLAILY